MNYSFDEIIAAKPESSYTEDALNEIRAISLDKDNWDLKGSYSFRASKYPSDIDVSDLLISCCDPDNTIKIFISKIQKIVSDSLQPNHWFLELKAGFDRRFKINLNQVDELVQLHDMKLLSDDEFTYIYNVITKGSTNKSQREIELEKEIIEKILKEHYTLRWSANDVLTGYKILPGGVTVNLFDAIKESDVVNIELIEVINDKFTEISNFFFLLYYSSDGKVHTINVPQLSYDNFPLFFGNELKKNIYKLFYSRLEPNFLKLAKRYFSYGRFFKDVQLVRAVYPLLDSNIGLAGQLKGELTTIEKLIESVDFNSIPIHILKKQLENIKSRLANIIDIPQDILITFNMNIINILTLRYLTPEYIINNIKPLKKYLFQYTNSEAYYYLYKVKLVPPPQKYLP